MRACVPFHVLLCRLCRLTPRLSYSMLTEYINACFLTLN